MKTKIGKTKKKNHDDKIKQHHNAKPHNTSARNEAHADLLALQDRIMKEVVGAARHFAAVETATRKRDRRFGRQKAFSSYRRSCPEPKGSGQPTPSSKMGSPVTRDVRRFELQYDARWQSPCACKNKCYEEHQT